MQGLDGFRVGAIAPMRQRPLMPIQIAPAAARHRASRADDRHVPHDARLIAGQAVRIDADPLEQPADQSGIGVGAGGDPTEIGLREGIIPRQFGDRRLVEVLERPQERLISPPLANGFGDMHGHLRIFA